jgi:hypothetical protein
MNFFFLSIIFIWAALFSEPLVDRSLNSEAILELANYFGISQKEDLVLETQKKWLRKPGKERWEIEKLSQKDQEFVINWAKKEGFFDEIRPSIQLYDKALILGATTKRMQIRLNYLKKLFQEGVRFSEIVWLTGERKLDSRVDEFTDLCETEFDAAKLLWEKEDIPNEMKNLPVLFISAPQKNGARPNTKDTLDKWLQEMQDPSTVLFISSQPYCEYQFNVIRETLRDNILFDIACPSVLEVEAENILDSVARSIWMKKHF